jgi:Putative adhesin
MTSWTVDAPTVLEFDEVTELNVRLMAGTVAVLVSDERPSLIVSELSGRPFSVHHEGGVLTVTYESLSWEGLLSFLKPRKDSAAVTISVPGDCRIQLGVLSASAVVSGLRAGAEVKSMSGDITLDTVTGDITAETMSGEVAACDLSGEVRFRSLSGGLTLAGGLVTALEGNTMSGPVTADVTLAGAGGIRVGTMSGEVTLRLPADSDAAVRLQSTSGAVSTDFETLRAVRAPASHTVSGNVGAGTGRVSVTTMSGAVTLLRRAAGSAPDGTNRRHTGHGTSPSARGDNPPYPPTGMESKTQ